MIMTYISYGIYYVLADNEEKSNQHCLQNIIEQDWKLVLVQIGFIVLWTGCIQDSK